MTRTSYSFVIELIGAVVLILGIGYWRDPGDFCFHGVQPHPFLFLVLLLAVQYGSIPGFLSALLLSALFLVIAKSRGFLNGDVFSLSNMNVPLQLIITGAIIGEISFRQKKKITRYQADLAELQDKHQELKKSHRAALMVKQELEKRIVQEYATFNTLYIDFRKMAGENSQAVCEALLEIIGEHFAASKIGVYLLLHGQYAKFTQRNMDDWPEILDEEIMQTHPMIAQCTQTVQVVAAHEIMQQGEDIVFCAPMPDPQNNINGYILVGDMPFSQYHRKNRNFLALLATWASYYLSMVKPKAAARIASVTYSSETEKTARFVQQVSATQRIESDGHGIESDSHGMGLLILCYGQEFLARHSAGKTQWLDRLHRYLSSLRVGLVGNYPDDEHFALFLSNTKRDELRELKEKIIRELHRELSDEPEPQLKVREFFSAAKEWVYLLAEVEKAGDL